MHHKKACLALGLAAVALAAACSSTQARAPAAGPRVAQTAPTNEAPIAESAERRAQRMWCTYLEALYRRATADGAPWKHRADCLAHASNASPVMLERTATCSQRALDGFEGDPLTVEYAAQVRRCGVEALEAAALGDGATEPFLEALCKRAEACGEGSYDECRQGLGPHVAGRLSRALGAINERSRARLRTCIEQAACSSPMADRLSGCIEPIMDDLLWLPAGSDG